MELTNHTYLRSRVDMQLANSLRKKASNKISGGSMTNAVDNAGGFSAGIMMKSNQYMLQTKRANIQNSLTFLQAQREGILSAKDIVEKIGVLKLKFDNPLLNETDRRNYDQEFVELSAQLSELRNKKFNGVELFSTANSGDGLFGATKKLTDDSATNAVTRNVLNNEDINFIMQAGEGINRGIGGLSLVNNSAQGIQKQIERISISGNIGQGDVFSFTMTPLTVLGEVDDKALNSERDFFGAKTITVELDTETPPGGISVKEYIRDKIFDELIKSQMPGDQTAGDIGFVQARKVGDFSISLAASMDGRPFTLLAPTSTGSIPDATVDGITDNTKLNIDNDIQSAVIQISLGHGSLPTGVALQSGDTLTLSGVKGLDGTSDISIVANYSGAAGSNNNPLDWQNDEAIIAQDLVNAINNAIDPTDGNTQTVATASRAGNTVTITSNIRGRLFNLDKTNLTYGGTNRAEQPATSTTATYNLTLPGTPPRTLEENDEVNVRIQSQTGAPVFYDVTRTVKYSAAGYDATSRRDEFNSLAQMMSAIEEQFKSSGPAGADLVSSSNANSVTLYKEDTAEQPIISITPQTNNASSITTQGTPNFGAKNSYNGVNTTGGTGTLELDIAIANNGTVTVPAVANSGSGYSVGDTVTVAAADVDNDAGNNLTFQVDSLVGKVNTLSSTTAATTRTLSGLATTATQGAGGSVGTGLTVDVEIAAGNLTITGVGGTTSGYDVGNQITIAGNLLGGTAGTDDVTLILAAADITGGNVTGIAASTTSTVTNKNWGTLSTSTSSGTGTGLTIGVNIAGNGQLTASVVSKGTGYVGTGAGQSTVKILGSQIGGTDGTDDVTFTVATLMGEVDSASHSAGTAKTTFTYSSGVTADTTDLEVSANYKRDGTIDGAPSITDPGSGINNNQAFNFTTGGGANGLKIRVNGTSDETWVNQNLNQGDQFIPADSIADEIVTQNPTNPAITGQSKVQTITIGADSTFTNGGNIAEGDIYRLTIREVPHAINELGKTPLEEITVSVMATAGQTAENIRDALYNEITTHTSYGAGTYAHDKHLPTVVIEGTDQLKFTAGYRGENFELFWGTPSGGQSAANTTLSSVGINPGDGISASVIQQNVSPFSVYTSNQMFDEMLSQNTAESARLYKEQEHLENNLVNTEQALGKITDTDYARASTDLVKNQLSMQMANQIISKSMRLSDLLIPLTTDHYRGSVLSSTL